MDQWILKVTEILLAMTVQMAADLIFHIKNYKTRQSIWNNSCQTLGDKKYRTVIPSVWEINKVGPVIASGFWLHVLARPLAQGQKLKCGSLTESRGHRLKLTETETCGIMGQSTTEEGALQRKSPRKLLGILLLAWIWRCLCIWCNFIRPRPGKTTEEL